MSRDSFAAMLDADRRLVILRLLVEARGTANESLIEKGLKLLGHRVGVSRDVVREHFRFLETAGLVVTEFFEDRVMLATISRRGVACAAGDITVAGVAEPSLGV